MSESRKESEQIAVLVWGEAGSALVTLLAPMIMVRVLGVAQVGAVAVLLTVYELVVAIFASGLPRVAIYYLSDRVANERLAIARQLMGLMLRSAYGASCVLLVLGLISAYGVDRIGNLLELTSGSASENARGLSYLIYLAVFVLFDLPTRLTPNIFLAEGRARISAGLEAFRACGMIASTLLPAVLGAGVGGIVVGLILFGAVFAATHGVCWHVVFRNRAPARSPLASRDIVANARPLAANQIVCKVLAGLDLWLVVWLCGQEAVAVYAQGAWMIPILNAILWSAGPVYIPRLVSHLRAGEPDVATAAYRFLMERSSFVIVPVASILVANAEDFVQLAYGDKYAGAAMILRIYCLRHFLRVGNLGSFLIAAGRPAALLRVSVVTIAANLVFSLPLVLAFGAVGAAIGTLLADVVEFGLSTIFLSRALRVRARVIWPWRPILQVWCLAGIAIASAWLSRSALSLHAAGGFAWSSFVVLAVFGALVQATGLTTGRDWRYLARFISMGLVRARTP